MTIPVYIKGKEGIQLDIGEEGTMPCTLHNHPPLNESSASYPFSQFLTDDGTASGSSNMRVDGSTTNVDFFIGALPKHDVYITSIVVQISGTGIALNNFGGLAALSNGVEFFLFNNALGRVVIDTDMTTNLDLIKLGNETAPVGSGTDAFKLDNTGGTPDSYLPVINLVTKFGGFWGITLLRGSLDKIGFTVRDNLTTTITTFNAKAYGRLV